MRETIQVPSGPGSVSYGWVVSPPYSTSISNFDWNGHSSIVHVLDDKSLYRLDQEWSGDILSLLWNDDIAPISATVKEDRGI